MSASKSASYDESGADLGEDERGERARRVLEAEVPVRNLAARDRVAVLLVDGRVDDPRVVERAAVQKRPREREDDEPQQGRADDGRRLSSWERAL